MVSAETQVEALMAALADAVERAKVERRAAREAAQAHYPYWGGWTEKGELLHLAAGSTGQCAVSACGLVLTGGAYDNVPDGSARCRSCLRLEPKYLTTTAPEADQ